VRRLAAALALGLLVGGQAYAAPAPKLGPPDWREVDPENALVIDTSKGRIIVEMVPEAAPRHVAQIRKLARARLYDGLVFFRVIDWFMDQTGDPKNTGDGGSSEANLKAEFTFRRDAATPFAPVAAPMGAEQGFVRSLPVISQTGALMPMTSDHKVAAWGTYCPGVAGMARDDDPDSANSQFFLMRQAYPSLDKRYTAWGRVLVGLDVVRSIKTGEPVQDPDRMTKVQVLADLPAAERPRVFVLDPKSPAFRKIVAAARMAKGADFSVCDVALPVQLR
jgi:peptidylprolyl isomerase